MMRWSLYGSALLALLGLIIPPGTAAPEPAKEKARILKLFLSELVPITPGMGKFPASFQMGSADEKSPATEKPAIKITLQKPFAMARYETTQELYQLIMGKNPSRWPGPRNSVERVNWDEANDFCRKLTAELRKERLLAEDEVIRLPSEAEWEYSCRAGTTTRYSFGDNAADLGDYAWFTGNAAGNDPPVGKKKPNAWGLYDMHGYVWEWCADAWHPNHEGADPNSKPRQGKDVQEHVLRGGAWTDNADSARSAFRTGKPSDTRTAAIGFRCVKAREDQQ